MKPLQGVNLGGWLLLERWMTPALFEGTDAQDEWSFMQTPHAVKKINHHRKTFITEKDFKWLAQNGVEAIRIPVGYWILEDDTPYVQASKYLDWAMKMAKKYELKVVIDVHGLPGSQNGYDHSGQAGSARWYKVRSYQQRSVDYVTAIAKRYAQHPQLWGFQIINEPFARPFHFALRHYYRQTALHLIDILRKDTFIIFSDAFTPRLMSGVLRGVDHPVIMDVHLYHMTTLFTKYLSLSWFMEKTIRRGELIKRLAKTQPIMIGEWSGVLRGDVIGKLSEDTQNKLFDTYVQLQQDVYQHSIAWFYWSYKTDGPGVWNFRSKVEDGSIKIIQK